MIKDDYEDDNLETALDMVATNIKKECSMMVYQHRTYRTNTTKEIAEDSAPYNLQQLLRTMHISEQSLPSFIIGNITASAIKKHPIPLQWRSGCTSTKRRRSSTCMTISSVVRMMTCCTSRNPRQWQNTSRLAMTDGNLYSERTCSSHSRKC